MRIYISVILLVLIRTTAFSQDYPFYTHSYLNPYLINPAYAGLEGRPFLDLTHRRQWLGVDNAPVTSNLTFHAPLFAGVNIGLNVTQDNFGIFKNSGALLTLGYLVPLGYNQYLSFGASGGAKMQNVDFTNVNLNDPALANIIQGNTVKLDGNLGLAYHIAGFNLGFSLQNIFNTKTYPTQEFEQGELGLIRNYIISADYMLYFGGDDYIFQPFGTYRSYEGFDSQYEAGGIFHVKHAFWIGGSYRQNYGIIGMLGIKVKNSLSVAYAYEMPALQANGINKSSHEINLGIAFGQKKDRAKKYQTFIASQKPIKPVKEKKPKKPDPVVEEPVIVDEPEEEEEEENSFESTLDSLQQGGNKIRLIIENSPPEDEVKKDSVISPVKVEPEVLQPVEKPAVVTIKGNHPFEIDRGHYVVVGAFGVVENAIRANDRLLSQGYTSDFGFSSDKKLFYVFVKSGTSAEEARKRRDEMRKTEAYKNAWYLLVE